MRPCGVAGRALMLVLASERLRENLDSRGRRGQRAAARSAGAIFVGDPQAVRPSSGSRAGPAVLGLDPPQDRARKGAMQA